MNSLGKGSLDRIRDAAHELLEAARAVLSESSGDSPPSIGALARLQEAIEKAEGRTP